MLVYKKRQIVSLRDIGPQRGFFISHHIKGELPYARTAKKGDHKCSTGGCAVVSKLNLRLRDYAKV